MTIASVLFVCVHNAGRSQMAAGYLQHLAGDRIEVRSAGSMPGNQVNPSAVAAMAEEGIDISSAQPKVLTTGLRRRLPDLSWQEIPRLGTR
jgi:arsenate reductase (thioredoxin)